MKRGIFSLVSVRWGRSVCAFTIVVLWTLAPIHVRAGKLMDVFTTSGCSCCRAWSELMRTAGFDVKIKEMAMGQLVKAKNEAGIRADLAACHTARVAGYIVEGHVPVDDIKRLLNERPNATGLVVSGMPIGSPGMETGDWNEAYDVLLLHKDGTTSIFAKYNRKP